ncbi:NTPase KAP family P-loop domain-containing protein 1-like [Anolis sagrei]|uniref:NTPase KAP family P-loop domain-containing protein 1-like n=1 Tax=Anolis sagrei TaxID=38937 RepID=UPI00351FA4BE
MTSRKRRDSEKHEIELEKNEDDFCLSLAKALCWIDPPETVGLYVPVGYFKKDFVDKVQYYMNENKQEGCGKLTFFKLVEAIFLMFFYFHIPLPTSDDKSRVHNIFIHCSAWECAGSDRVWAGLITALCDGIIKHFGRFPMSVYRTVGRKGDNTKDSNRNRKWISKKYLCLPLWVATLLIYGVAIGLFVFICLYGFPVGSLTGDFIVLLEVITGIGLVVPAFPAAKKVYNLIWNVLVTQKAQLEKQMNRTDVSAQLGFMGKVKKEVNTIIEYLQFMETFQDRKLQVVLKITNLDRCTPNKVVRVLDAMNILLSDSKSPFISILVADLNVIVKYVESEVSNGYEFLNHIITLPFSFPKMDEKDKKKVLEKMVNCRVKHEKKLEGDKKLEDDQQNSDKGLNESKPCSCCKSADRKLCGRCGDDSHLPLVVVSSMKKEEEEEEVNLINKALRYLENENMMKYVISSKLQMKRIINTIVVMARLMVKKHGPSKFCLQKVTSWVVLANQWPCRLSWILQCIEDDEQMGGFSEEQDSKVTLSDVYERYMEEFDGLKDELNKLLELDGDPELFQNFLDREFEVEDVKTFLPCTVNLDSSLKRYMELGRSSCNLKWTKKTDRFSKSILLEMSEEEICEKMDSLRLENAQKYKEMLRKHRLNGQALLYSNQREIKNTLGMNLRDWVAFRMHFLGSVPDEEEALGRISPLGSFT